VAPGQRHSLWSCGSLVCGTKRIEHADVSSTCPFYLRSHPRLASLGFASFLVFMHSFHFAYSCSEPDLLSSIWLYELLDLTTHLINTSVPPYPTL